MGMVFSRGDKLLLEVSSMLEKELETYRRELPRLLAESEDRYVLIHEDKVVDTFVFDDDAIREGWRRFGLVPIFVKRIQSVDKPVFYARNLKFPETTK
jgi:hypothetical protein